MRIQNIVCELMLAVPEKEPEVAAGTPLKGMITPALTPGKAGPWIWEAVALVVRFVKLTL